MIRSKVCLGQTFRSEEQPFFAAHDLFLTNYLRSSVLTRLSIQPGPDQEVGEAAVVLQSRPPTEPQPSIQAAPPPWISGLDVDQTVAVRERGQDWRHSPADQTGWGFRSLLLPGPLPGSSVSLLPTRTPRPLGTAGTSSSWSHSRTQPPSSPHFHVTGSRVVQTGLKLTVQWMALNP